MFYKGDNYSDAGGMPDGTHSYRVQACNGSCGALSAPAMVTVETPLVQGLGVNPNPATANTTYTVSWQAASGAVTYQVQEQAAGASVWSDPATSPSLSYTIAGGKPVGTWNYRVRACRHAGDESYCGGWATVSQQVLEAPPGIPVRPTGLYSSPNPSTTGTYTLTWSDSTDATYWEVDEKYQHDTPSTWRQVASPTVRSWKPPSPKTGYGDYTYRVRACNRNHECSLDSAEHIQKVHLPNVLPERPATGTVSPNPSTTGLYTLTWPAAARATRYRLKENDGSATWTDLPEQTTRSWSPASPKQNGFYAYHIQGCNKYGCGDWTAVAAQVRVAIPTELPMTVPADFAVSGGFRINTWMKFTWGPVEGAAMYQIRQELYPCHGQAPTHLVVGAATPQPYQQRAALGMCNGHEQDPSTWRFSIRACADLQAARCSEYSPTVTVTTAGTGSNPVSVPTTITYIHTDGLRSPVAETNASGQVTARLRYEPYGKTLMPQPQGPGYTGRVADAATGLSYMQQRYYDPVAGRFLSVDPIPASPASFNRYWYANNNPYRFTDPDGRDAVAVGFPNYKIEFAGSKWSNLGHAGILLINPSNGLTRYYEFGRYNGTSGIVRNFPVSNVTMQNGAPTTASLAKVMDEISQTAGQGGPIEGAYFAAADFKKMEAFASGLVGKTSANGGYGDWSTYNSCGTFMQDTLESGGVDTPWMADPRPNSYLGELQGAKGAQSFRFQNGGFQGVFRVEGRLDSKRLDRELNK